MRSQPIDTLILATVLAGLAAAQTTTSAPFAIRALQSNVVQNITDGGTIGYNADGIGLPSNAVFSVTYRPSTTTLNANIVAMDLSGATDFSFVSVPDFTNPITLTGTVPAYSFAVRYLPITSKAVTARITVTYAEIDSSPSSHTVRTGTFTINLTGVAPEFAYSYTVQPNGNSTLLSSGGTIALPQTNIADTSSVLVTLFNKGSGAGVVTTASISDSATFALTGLPFLPFSVDGGKSMQFSVRFTPTVLTPVSASVNVGTATGRDLAFTVQGSGLGAQYLYEIVTAQDTKTVSPGSTIKLPDATVGATQPTTATIRVTNTGNASGQITPISVVGTGLALSQQPILPYTLTAGTSLTLVVAFSPAQSGNSSGQLRIGADIFYLQGNAVDPTLSFSYTAGGGAISVQNLGTVVFAPTEVGSTSTANFTVRNDGAASIQITSIGASPTNTFAMGSLPSIPMPFLPYTLAAGSSVTMVVVFSPTQSGNSSGQLKIGANNFYLQGNGVGPNLTFSYTAGAGAITVLNSGTVVFAPATVGGTSTASFTVRNDGTASTQITSISASPTNTFTLGSLPNTPIMLAPTAVVTFSIVFAPVATGTNTGTLRIDTQTFTLSGSTSPPPALPAYSYSSAGGNVDAQQQPAVGLSLSTAYPIALTGALNLAFNSDVYANDPSVQFATGGRSIAFTIPAGTKQAVFQNGATQVRLQTGTVAGAILLSPAFATSSGGIDVTPANPPALTLTVPQAAPRIMNVLLSTKTATGLTLLVTGYATGRSITQMDLQFTPTVGENLGTTKLTLNVEPTFTAWYQGTASQAYGSQFTATIPLTLAGDIKNVSQVSDTIQSVSVTLTNRQGVSAAQSVTVH